MCGCYYVVFKDVLMFNFIVLENIIIAGLAIKSKCGFNFF